LFTSTRLFLGWVMKAVTLSICICLATSLPAADITEIPEQAAAARAILEPWQKAHTQPTEPYLHIVCFTPSDREFPVNHLERLTRMLQHIQAFYAQEMERNGFGPLTFNLQLDRNDQLVIHEVRGAKTFAEYEKKSGGDIRREALPVLAKAGIDANQATIAIFCNLATWDEQKLTFIHKSPYYAGGTYLSGTAWQLDSPELDTLNLPKKEPLIRDGEYGCISLGRHNSIFIGGMAHELGHAFGLPHCTARPDEAVRGSALMGAGNRTYFEDLRGEGRGSFLTFAHALRLASHPLFNGRLETRKSKPEVTARNIRIRAEDKSIVVAGTLSGTPPLYGLVAYFDPEGNDDYNATSATAIPAADGSFQLGSSALTAGKRGVLRLIPLHANGAIPGDNDLSKLRFSYSVSDAGIPELKTIQIKQLLAPLVAALNSGNPNLARKEKDKIKSREASLIAAALINVTAPTESPAQAKTAGKSKPASASLTSFKAESATVGWMKPSFNRVPDESMLLEAGGEIFATGIFAHAPARHEYALGGKWKSFTGKVGVATGHSGSVIFEIMGDGKSLWKSPVVEADQLLNFDVNLTGINQLELTTAPSEDGTNSDWGLWLEPKLAK
jgi:hypothetical protein